MQPNWPRWASRSTGGSAVSPLEFWADPSSPYHRPEFDPRRRTVLYCASGGRSALGAVTLAQLGYTDVAHLDGGIKGWLQAGYPVVQQNNGARP